jgi:hypothetical protein
MSSLTILYQLLTTKGQEVSLCHRNSYILDYKGQRYAPYFLRDIILINTDSSIFVVLDANYPNLTPNYLNPICSGLHFITLKIYLYWLI